MLIFLRPIALGGVRRKRKKKKRKRRRKRRRKKRKKLKRWMMAKRRMRKGTRNLRAKGFQSTRKGSPGLTNYLPSLIRRKVVSMISQRSVMALHAPLHRSTFSVAILRLQRLPLDMSALKGTIRISEGYLRGCRLL